MPLRPWYERAGRIESRPGVGGAEFLPDNNKVPLWLVVNAAWPARPTDSGGIGLFDLPFQNAEGRAKLVALPSEMAR